MNKYAHHNFQIFWGEKFEHHLSFSFHFTIRTTSCWSITGMSKVWPGGQLRPVVKFHTARCLSQEGNRRIPGKKGTTDARTIWSCLAGWFGVFSWHNKVLYLNTLNTSLQGQDAAVNQLHSHTQAFGTKLQLFKKPTCHKHSPIPHIFQRCRKQWGTQQTLHLWLGSLNGAFRTSQLLKRRSDFSPLHSWSRWCSGSPAWAHWPAVWHWVTQSSPTALSLPSTW